MKKENPVRAVSSWKRLYGAYGAQHGLVPSSGKAGVAAGRGALRRGADQNWSLDSSPADLTMAAACSSVMGTNGLPVIRCTSFSPDPAGAS